MTKFFIFILSVFGLFYLVLVLNSIVIANSFQEIVFQDDFDNLSSWNVFFESPNSAYVDRNLGYKSNSSLVLDYSTDKSFINLTKVFDVSRSDVLVRIFFYDDMDDSLGTMFTVSSYENQSGSQTPFHTGIGVNTAISKDYYVLRHNSYAKTFITDIRRSKGWHMFEFIITPTGVYSKIDNEILFEKNGDRSFSPFLNDKQKNLKALGIVSTWGLFGKSWYDQVLVARSFTGDWKNYLVNLVRPLYQGYAHTDFSPLFIRNDGANDIRALLSTATSFYVYGRLTNNKDASERGIMLFKQVLDNFDWSKVNDWQLGIVMGLLIQDSRILWRDLDRVYKSKIENLVYQKASRYLDSSYPYASPKSGYVGDSKAEENSWHAYFLAQAVNYFPNIPNRKELEDKARCFAYHSITTGENYCGFTTQTVYKDSFVLENHGIPHPVYALATIHQLALAALSYKKTGKDVPLEFSHNVVNLYDKFVSGRLDKESFHPKDTEKVDWFGAHKSLFIGFVAFDYLKDLGYNLQFDLDKVFQKRSLFYYDIPCVWLTDYPSSINTSTYQSTAWFLDSIHSGDYVSALLLLLSFDLSSDLNSDSKVDIFDYNILVTNFGKTGDAGWIPADINKDGKVDIFDYNILVSEFGKKA